MKVQNTKLKLKLFHAQRILENGSQPIFIAYGGQRNKLRLSEIHFEVYSRRHRRHGG